LREVIDVLEMRPDYTEAYLCLGWLHSKNGDIEKAIPAFRRAVELMPDSYDAHLYLGNLYVQRGEIKNALDEYRKASEIVSKENRNHLEQGMAFLNGGNIEQAINCFNKVLKNNSECEEAYTLLADAYEKKGLYSVGMVLRLQGERRKQGVQD